MFFHTLYIQFESETLQCEKWCLPKLSAAIQSQEQDFS
uniref:Uncharacterized protein n=1 Tax=Anguilla anguilla TaxID=7936 RepID=A0A0E9WNE3_ANGAN